MRGVLCLSLALLLSLGAPSAFAAFETITSGTSRSVTLGVRSHDAYEVAIAGGQTVTVRFTADSNVDFYVLTATGYSEYVDPNSSTFHYRELKENTQSFSYSTTQSALIFVIDNDDISATGAPSTVPVMYALAIEFVAPSDGGLSIILAIVAAGAVGSVIGVVLLRQRTRRQSALVPQPVPPQPMGIPLTPVQPATLPVVVGQAPGAIRRSMNEVEREVLVRDFKGLRLRMLYGSMLGLVFAVAYNILPNLLTLGLSIIAFLSPAMAYGVAKLRGAIVAGQVVEYQGVPVFLGSTRIAKQEFYRLQFGTERVLVSSSLYGRLVPNQPNTLTVLQGANVAIAINGMPLAKSEPVRVDTPAAIAVGAP